MSSWQFLGSFIVAAKTGCFKSTQANYICALLTFAILVGYRTRNFGTPGVCGDHDEGSQGVDKNNTEMNIWVCLIDPNFMFLGGSLEKNEDWKCDEMMFGFVGKISLVLYHEQQLFLPKRHQKAMNLRGILPISLTQLTIMILRAWEWGIRASEGFAGEPNLKVLLVFVCCQIRTFL